MSKKRNNKESMICLTANQSKVFLSTQYKNDEKLFQKKEELKIEQKKKNEKKVFQLLLLRRLRRTSRLQ